VSEPNDGGGRVPTLVALLAGAVGLVLLVAGWAGTSGRLTLASQVGFVSVAVTGLVVAGAGALLSVLARSNALTERTVRFEQACAAWIEDGWIEDGWIEEQAP
jgi:hypothetical protein